MITVTWPWPQFIFRAELHVSSLSELMCTWQCIKLKGQTSCDLGTASARARSPGGTEQQPGSNPWPERALGGKTEQDLPGSAGWRRAVLWSRFVCWSLWGMSAHMGRAGSKESKSLKNGSLIHCQLHGILDGRPGSYSRKIRGSFHMNFHCVS